MFAIGHMALGALVDEAVPNRVAAAALAVLTHPLVDNPRLWHAPWEWPEGSPSFLRFIPYPHDAVSWGFVVGLVALTVGFGYLMRSHWWGMLWALSPDLLDWLLIRPLLGRELLHRFWAEGGPIDTPIGFAVELGVVLLVLVAVSRSRA
ncbi:MAG: hypothetical protein Q8O40_00100 [Chloroflexota bacterium]|nr:hypothetical protein [Chloroflexota bacterium]